VFVKTHVITSPTSSWIAFVGLPSLHVADVSVHPSVGDSTTEYVPAGTFASCCPPSLSVNCSVCPAPLPVKENTVGSPSGSVCFWMMIRPFVACALETPRNSAPSTMRATTKTARCRTNARCRIEMSPFASEQRPNPFAFVGA
jgi:hypothetical protein